MINKIAAVFFLILTLPLIAIIYVVTKMTSKGQFIFKQKRVGKGMKIFTMYKIRAMIEGAEKVKRKYYSLNEVDGPTFKIHNDPRHTKVGRFLSHTGLDELPQLINVLKGEMALVGPRPLPVDEAFKIPLKYKKRFTVLPGITSPWIVKGAHKLTFAQWMELDLEYIKRKSLWYDIKILFLTIQLVLSIFFRKLFGNDGKK